MTYHRKPHQYHKPARPRSPSPPPGMSSDQAIDILSDRWGTDSTKWKPADCGFGPDPRSWPPRMLMALANLARAAGWGSRRRDAALQLVEDLVAEEQRNDGRLCKATPEHVNLAAEIIVKKRERTTDDRRDSGQDRRHSGVDRDEYERYSRYDERDRDTGEGFSFRGAAEQRDVTSREDTYYGGVDRGVSKDTRRREPYESKWVSASYGKQEQRVDPKADQPRNTNRPSYPQEQLTKVDQGSGPMPPQSNTTSATAIATDETTKLNPQHAKRLLEGDETESDETHKKPKLTEANAIPLPAFAASRFAQPWTSRQGLGENLQSQATTSTAAANSSNYANTNNAATQTDEDNKNKELIVTLEAELASLQAKIAKQGEQLAEERAAQSQMSAEMEKLQLDLDLAESARASTEADAGKWRAFGTGMRAMMRDNKRLSKAEMETENLKSEAAKLRAGMRIVHEKYLEAQAQLEACDVDAEKVKVIKGDDELKMVNSVLRRENEALRIRLEKFAEPVSSGRGQANTIR